MKILFSIDQFFPQRGGAERYLYDLGKALDSRGHTVLIAFMEGEKEEFFTPIAISAPKYPRILREIVFARAIKKTIKDNVADRVVGFRHQLSVNLFQPHEGLFLDSLMGGIRPLSPSKTIRRMVFFKKLFSLKNLFFLYADRRLFLNHPNLQVAALSHKTAGAIKRRHKNSRVVVIPNGVDLNRFHPGLRKRHRESILKKYQLQNDTDIILFIAHNFRLKGLKEAILGFAEYAKQGAPTKLMVVGKGNQKPYLAMIKKLNLEGSVVFSGAQNQMAPFYGAADLLLHPSFYDPCSLVVLEAMGAGVPVITSKHNGASELMENKRAGVVLPDPRDRFFMARAIKDVLDPKNRAMYRDNAMKLGASCGFEHHVDSMERWILESSPLNSPQ